MSIPKDLKYTKEHEWVAVDGNMAKVGITDYAQSQLGDIVYIELPEVETDVSAGEPFGSIEAVKAVSDLVAPLTGVVKEANGTLADSPELANNSPYADGWMIVIEVADAGQLDGLLSAEDYETLTASEE